MSKRQIRAQREAREQERHFALQAAHDEEQASDDLEFPEPAPQPEPDRRIQIGPLDV